VLRKPAIYFGLPIAQRDNGLGVMFFDNLICRPELKNTLAQTASVRFRRQPWAERVAAAMPAPLTAPSPGVARVGSIDRFAKRHLFNLLRFHRPGARNGNRQCASVTSTEVSKMILSTRVGRPHRRFQTYLACAHRSHRPKRDSSNQKYGYQCCDMLSRISVVVQESVVCFTILPEGKRTRTSTGPSC
jgi:hypothetical protein